MSRSINIRVRFFAEELRRQVDEAFGGCCYVGINDYARAAIGRLAGDLPRHAEGEETDDSPVAFFAGRYTAWLAVMAEIADLELADHYALGAKCITPSRSVFKEAQRELGRLDNAGA